MKSFITLLLIPVLALFISCSRHIYKNIYPTLNDGKYDSEFPYKSSSTELQKVTETVKKLNCTAYYKSYVFDEESHVLPGQLSSKFIKQKASKEIYFNNSVAGTATIVFARGTKVALITCAHVVDFPDTIISYVPSEREIERNMYVQSISFKQRQSNFIPDFSEGGELDILEMDKASDIAILGKEFSKPPLPPVPVFNYPLGDAKQLEWGSFVYLIGYPKGFQMITKGIVSSPDRDKKGGFIVDALFNKGFSGGIVLAIRDGVPNFELVGMANSVAVDVDYLLAPNKEVEMMGYDPRIPYRDKIYVAVNKEINYGITFVISTESIRQFIRTNLDEFRLKGYDLSSLL